MEGTITVQSVNQPAVQLVCTELDEQEQIIRTAGIQSFLIIGAALREIREKELYRQRGYQYFEQYLASDVKENFGIKRSQAYNYICASIVAESMGNCTSKILDMPGTEHQYRLLRSLPEKERASVWEKVSQEPSEKWYALLAEEVEARKPPRLSASEEVVNRVRSTLARVLGAGSDEERIAALKATEDPEDFRGSILVSAIAAGLTVDTSLNEIQLACIEVRKEIESKRPKCWWATINGKRFKVVSIEIFTTYGPQKITSFDSLVYA